MTTADTQDVVTPADSRNGEAGRLCVQRLVTASGQEPQPQCQCGRKAYLIDPLFPYHSEQNRCWYHRGGTKWCGREKEYQREYRKANRQKINARNRANPNNRTRSKSYRKAHMEQFRGYNRKYRQRHGEEINAKRRGHYPQKPYDSAWWAEWRKRNAEKLKVINRAQGKRQREQLSDTYVRRVLATGLRVLASELPASAVELNRAIIKLKRILWRNQKT